MNPGLAIQGMFIVQPHHILPSQAIFWSKVECVVVLVQPKTELYMVVEYTDTNENSTFVHQKGT